MDSKQITDTIVSQLPASMERAAVLLKQALNFYPELKQQFLSGSSEEKANAKRLASQIFMILDSEIFSICQTLGINMEMFNQEIRSYMSQSDAAQYTEAMQLIRIHQQEFASIPKKMKRPLKIKSSRLYG